MKLCSINNCSAKSRARGLCKKHYLYASRHSCLPEKQPYKRTPSQKTETDRFWLKVDKKHPDECWIWMGAKHKSGYGNFKLDNKKIVKSHRYSFLITHGQLDESLYVCHSCDNPSCVNPNHLWQGTAKENNKDCRDKNRAVFPPDQKVENHSQHILTNNDVLDIRKKFHNGVKQADLMRSYQVSRNTIYKICRNKSWQHLGENNEST